MKKVFFTLLSLAIFSLGYAQSDQKAVDLLNSVSAKANAYKSLNIEFKFYIENLKDASRNMHPGKVWYRGDRYKMDMMGQLIFSDGKTNYTYLKDAEEINITEASSADETVFNPQSILNNFTKDYKCRWISDKFENNRALVEIDLYPVKIDDKKYSKITLRIDKTKTQIFSVHYMGKDGINYYIEIDKFIENPTIADKDIIFNAASFPGADIIDMR